jgi:hypothetical protein
MVLAALLASCNLPKPQDPAAIQTEAAMTVEAKLTAVAPPPTATPTVAPFPTLPVATAVLPTLPPAATATSGCDNADFVTDVTIPDDSSVDAGSDFTKTWRFKNVGSCSWTPSYALVFVSGQQMDGPAVQAIAGNINGGQTVDLSVQLTAPEENGSYQGNWGIRNATGVIFAHFWVKIKVEDGTGGPLAVTHVTYSYSTSDNASYLDCPTITAHITANAAGDVKYHWTRSDGADGDVKTLHFASAGTKDVEEAWYLPTAAGSETRWLGIYIDSPNHQNFGHKEFTSTCSAP